MRKMPSLSKLLFEQDVSWDQKYEDFVSKLGANAQDAKTKAFITAGLKDGGPATDDKFKFTDTSLAVKDLIPTQNEVDIDKSLAFPMKKNPGDFVKYASGEGPFTLGSKIITYNGKYVIDGHHRWSQLYACNSEAKITATDITIAGNLNPLDVLKAVQASIAATSGEVPVHRVEGTNLLKVDKETLDKWLGGVPVELFKAVKDDSTAVKNMKSASGSEAKDAKQLVKDYVEKNVDVMQKNSQPVQGAPERGYMPQTDDAGAWKKPLEKGEIDIMAPRAQKTEESKMNSSDIVLERLQKLAGILKD